MIRVDVEDLAVGCRRLVDLLLLDEDGGKGEPGLREFRVLSGRALEDLRGLLQVAGEAQIVAQHDGILVGERLAPLQLAQVSNRTFILSGRLIGDGPGAEHHEHAGILGEQLGQLAYGLERLRPGDGHAVPPQPGREADAVLRVASRGCVARRCRRCRRSPARPGARPSPRRPCGMRRALSRRHHLLQAAAHALEACRLRGREVVGLSGIGFQIVELGRGASMNLKWAVRQA